MKQCLQKNLLKTLSKNFIEIITKKNFTFSKKFIRFRENEKFERIVVDIKFVVEIFEK